MTLLSTLQDAADELGLPRPASSSSSDVTTRQLVALTKAAGDEIARKHDWNGLTIPGQIPGNGSATDFTLPVDFERLVTGPALWKQGSLIARYAGPAKSWEWTAVTGAVSVGMTRIYRLLSGVIQVYPAPATDEVIRLEYLSTHWILNALGTVRKLAFTADDDRMLVPERIVKLGLKWRWKRQKGLAYADEKEEFEIELDKAAFSDRAPRAVASGAHDDDLPTPVAPETIVV